MANQLFQIPLVNTPQSFEIDLAGVTYTLTVKWNDMGQSWFLDIADSNQVPIASGIPLITGADMLDGLAYLGIQGQLFIYTNALAVPEAVPTLDNLGVTTNLYFSTSVAA